MNETKSVYTIEPKDSVFNAMSGMRIVLVKGIGYMVISKNQNNPDIIRRMGEVVARAFDAA